MKRVLLLLAILGAALTLNAQKHIRINYVGYLPKSVKVAVYFEEKNPGEPLSKAEKLESQVSASGQTAWKKRPQEVSTEKNSPSADMSKEEFVVFDAVTDLPVFSGQAERADGSKWVVDNAFRLNFSALQKPGGYYIRFRGTYSPVFKIGADVYDGAADILLYYMRQQQCGYNPFTDTLCHQLDGYIVDHPERNGEKIDVRGGWHDASDYLQYQTTSATATYHLTGSG